MHFFFLCPTHQDLEVSTYYPFLHQLAVLEEVVAVVVADLLLENPEGFQDLFLVVCGVAEDQTLLEEDQPLVEEAQVA